MRTAAIVCAAAAMLGGVFALPWAFPPKDTLLSASKLAGYNNSLAFLCYGATLVLLVVLVAPRLKSGPPPEFFSSEQPLFVVPPAVVNAVIGAIAAGFAGLYFVKRGFVFAEGLYFQESSYRVTEGAAPFVDFHFFYGPAMVYPAAFLARFFALPAAYAIYFIFSYCSAVYLVYVVLAAAIASPRARLIWFLVFALGFFNPITGLNYTLLRFVLPAVTLLATWRCHQRISWRRAAVAVFFIANSVLISPEIGLVAVLCTGFMGAVSLVFEPRPESRAKRVAVYAGLPIAGVVLPAVLLFSVTGTTRLFVAYVQPIVSFTAGGWNTQIDPSIPMLALLVGTVVGLAFLWRDWWARRSEAQAPLIAAFAASVVLLQRAVFGKADVEHIAYSGLPALFILAWRSASSGTKWEVPHVVLGIAAPLQFYHAMLFLPVLLRPPAPPPAADAAPAPRPAASKAELQASMARAVEHFGAERNFFFYQLDYYRLPIFLRYRLRPVLHHPSLDSIFTPAEMQEIIGDLRSSDVVLVTRRSDLEAKALKLDEPKWWNYLTSSPLPGSTVFNLTRVFKVELEEPLRRHLVDDYELRFEDGDIIGMELRKPR